MLSLDCFKSMPNRQLSITRFSMTLRWPRTSRQESSVSCESPEPVRCNPRKTAPSVCSENTVPLSPASMVTDPEPSMTSGLVITTGPA